MAKSKQTTTDSTSDSTSEVIADSSVDAVTGSTDSPAGSSTDDQPSSVDTASSAPGADVPESTDTDEVIFLRHIMNIQHEGGWGTHLDGVILNRIRELKNK